MKEQLRKSGIDIIGDVSWGTHICQFYQTKEDLMEILITYFKAGLENNEFCLWVTSRPVEVEDAKQAMNRVIPDFNAYLDKGQIEIIPYTDWFTTDGIFDSKKVSNTRLEKLNHALSSGYDGMRLSGNTTWLVKEDWCRFIEFKEQTDKNMDTYRMINLCTYFLDRHNAAEIIDVVVNHQFALIKREGNWKRIESPKRKQAEEALREGEERLRFALETIHAGAWDLDLVDHTAYRSLEHDRIFGYEQLLPQWTYEMFLDHVLTEDRAMVDSKFRKATTALSDWSFECRIRRVDGEVRWIWAAGRHRMDAAGSVRRMAGIVQDITERKQLEEQIYQRAEEMETIMEVAPVAIWIGHDPLSNNITGNKMANEFYEARVGENVSANTTSLRRFFRDGRELTADELPMQQASLKDIDVRNSEIDVLLPSGEWRALLGSASPLHDAEGHVRGSIGAFLDITERKQAEEALRESEEKYRNLIETANEGIWILQWMPDSKARTTYVNKKMAEMLGYSQEEMIGKSVRDFTDEEGKAIFETNMKRRQKGINESHEFKLLRKDGSPLWALVNSKSLLDKNGRFIGSMSMLTDISERKEAETKLKETLDNLENLVKKRTAELEEAYNSLKEKEKNLAEAQKMAHIGNWDWDLVTGEVYWSDEMYRIYGRNPQEPGTTYDELLNCVHPNDRDYVANVIKTGLKGEPQGIDYRIISANGEERTVHAQAKIIFDEKNIPLRVKGIIQDVTDRKEAEEMLKESEGKFKALFNLLPVGVSITDEDRNILDANLALERILDFSRSDLLTGKYRARKYIRSNGMEMPDEDFPSVRALKEKGSIQSSEIGIIKENGSTVWTDVSAIYLPFSEGQVAVTTRDITESKKTAEELQKTEERYRIVTEQTGQLVYDYDAMKDTTDWAGNIEDITGYTPDEFRSMSLKFWLSLIHPEDLDMYLEKYERYLKSGDTYRTEYRFRKKNEEYIYLEDNGICLRDEKGNVHRILGVIKDVTERKKAEIFLANIEIARKKEIHHRIKNNLQVISSLLDLQAEKFRGRKCVEDSEVLKAFRVSQDRVISIALIHEELHEGRGTDKLNFSPYLERLVKNLFQTYRLENVNTSLNIELENDILFDMDIAVPLGIIINELVSNALKYAFPVKDKGKIEIKLFREEEESVECANNGPGIKKEDNGTGYVLKVSDNGVGIPEGFNSDKSENLGLQLVAILVDQLEGKLELKSDSGTSFIIKFRV